MTDDATHTERPEARQTRHLAMLEELATLAMALTRAAAEKAQAHLDTPEDGPDPVLAFTRLSRTVRQTIALEDRIANPKPNALGQRPGPKPVDEPREFIAEAARHCAKADKAATRRHGPTSRHIERHIDERIDADDITTLINQNATVYEIIATICEDLGVRCEVAEQPDENLLPLTEALELRRFARTIQQPDPDDDEDEDEDGEEEEDWPPYPPPSETGSG